MRKYSSLSWKRTWCWSNSTLISALDLGALTKSEKAGSQTTTTRYRDAQGRAKFKGNKRLKASQYLIWICWTDKKHMGDISLFIVSTPVAARQAIYLQICWETCQHGSPIPCRKDSTSDWGREVCLCTGTLWEMLRVCYDILLVLQLTLSRTRCDQTIVLTEIGGISPCTCVWLMTI